MCVCVYRVVPMQSADPRVLAAAAEVTARGLAKITLLGQPDKVLAQAKSQGVDLTGVFILDPVVGGTHIHTHLHTHTHTHIGTHTTCQT